MSITVNPTVDMEKLTAHIASALISNVEALSELSNALQSRRLDPILWQQSKSLNDIALSLAAAIDLLIVKSDDLSLRDSLTEFLYRHNFTI